MSVNAQIPRPRIQRWHCSMRLFYPSATAGGHQSSLVVPQLISCLTPPTIYGGRRMRPSSPPAAASRISHRITVASAPEVSGLTDVSNLHCANNMSTAPAKLDTSLMTEPRMIHGAPRVSKTANTARRKPLPKLMNGLAITPSS